MQIERMKAAALRLGSQGLSTSFDDHLLIIGDAAGHIDPLTGEGIHTAIMVRLRRRNVEHNAWRLFQYILLTYPIL
jgi:hypothetical protein